MLLAPLEAARAARRSPWADRPSGEPGLQPEGDSATDGVMPARARTASPGRVAAGSAACQPLTTPPPPNRRAWPDGALSISWRNTFLADPAAAPSPSRMRSMLPMRTELLVRRRVVGAERRRRAGQCVRRGPASTRRGPARRSGRARDLRGGGRPRRARGGRGQPRLAGRRASHVRRARRAARAGRHPRHRLAPRRASRAPSAHADLHALGDIGVAVLVARDAQDAADLTVVAHRAAEDAETPGRHPPRRLAGELRARSHRAPRRAAGAGALEPAPTPLGASDHGLAPHRRAAARVPFALASAMRAFERHASRRAPRRRGCVHRGRRRRHDRERRDRRVRARHRRAPARDAAASRTLGLVQVLVLRPFPGAGARHARSVVPARVAVIERADAPLCAVEPARHRGEGRVRRRAHLGARLSRHRSHPDGLLGVHRSRRVARRPRASSLAVVENVLQGEQGRRAFRVGRGGEQGPDVVPSRPSVACSPDSFTLRWAGDPSVPIDILVDLYGGHVRATPLLRRRPTKTCSTSRSRPAPCARITARPSSISWCSMARPSHDEGRVLEAVAALRDGGTVIMTASASRQPYAQAFARRSARLFTRGDQARRA